MNSILDMGGPKFCHHFQQKVFPNKKMSAEYGDSVISGRLYARVSSSIWLSVKMSAMKCVLKVSREKDTMVDEQDWFISPVANNKYCRVHEIDISSSSNRQVTLGQCFSVTVSADHHQLIKRDTETATKRLKSYIKGTRVCKKMAAWWMAMRRKTEQVKKSKPMRILREWWRSVKEKARGKRIRDWWIKGKEHQGRAAIKNSKLTNRVKEWWKKKWEKSPATDEENAAGRQKKQGGESRKWWMPPPNMLVNNGEPTRRVCKKSGEIVRVKIPKRIMTNHAAMRWVNQKGCIDKNELPEMEDGKDLLTMTWESTNPDEYDTI